MLKIIETIILMIIIIWSSYSVYLIYKNVDSWLDGIEEILYKIAIVYWVIIVLVFLFIICYGIVR